MSSYSDVDSHNDIHYIPANYICDSRTESIILFLYWYSAMNHIWCKCAPWWNVNTYFAIIHHHLVCNIWTAYMQYDVFQVYINKWYTSYLASFVLFHSISIFPDVVLREILIDKDVCILYILCVCNDRTQKHVYSFSFIPLYHEIYKKYPWEQTR